MFDPEVQYSLARFEQRRRDKKLERRRAYLVAPELDPVPHLASGSAEESAGCELEAAS